MQADPEDGPGDVRMFPAEDLERLYKLGGADPQARILGRELNKLLDTRRYKDHVWYNISAKGIQKS